MAEHHSPWPSVPVQFQGHSVEGPVFHWAGVMSSELLQPRQLHNQPYTHIGDMALDAGV